MKDTGTLLLRIENDTIQMDIFKKYLLPKSSIIGSR